MCTAAALLLRSMLEFSCCHTAPKIHSSIRRYITIDYKDLNQLSAVIVNLPEVPRIFLTNKETLFPWSSSGVGCSERLCRLCPQTFKIWLDKVLHKGLRADPTGVAGCTLKPHPSWLVLCPNPWAAIHISFVICLGTGRVFWFFF